MAKVLQLCPDCGSSELSYEAGMITGQKYHCHKCGYVGPFVIERDLDELERQAEELERSGEQDP